jgi:hypothetical protein
MAYDETLAARVRAELSDRDDVTERPMFGGLTFMLAGHMCCGVNREELIVRLTPGDADAASAQPHARAMDLTGRPMRGFVTIRPEGLNGRTLARWVARAVAHAQTLPPKPSQRNEPARR